MKTSRMLRAALVAALLVAATPSVASAQSGALDTSFADHGVRYLDRGRYYGAQPVVDVLPLAHGKAMVVSSLHTADGTEPRLDRLRRNGTTDPGFRARESGPALARRVVRWSEGRVLLAGSGQGSFSMTSYLHDGGRDTSFGYRGRVTTSITTGDDEIYDVRVDRDGGILAAGVAGDRFAVVRYRADGSLDPGFGDQGIVVTAVGFEGNAVARAMRLQPDGRLVVAGSSAFDSRSTPSIQVMRFAPDGTLDPSFGGGDGVVTTAPRDYEATRADAVLLQPDGDIVAGGTAYMGDNSSFCLVRYLADGTPDPSFGLDGFVATDVKPYYAEANALARQGDGKIVAAGWTDREGGPDALALVRYLPSGRPDRTFSGNGVAVFGLGPRQDSRLLAVATRHGRIVAGGETGREGSPNTVGVVVRVHQ